MSIVRYIFLKRIAVLTGAGGRASKRSLVARFTVTENVELRGRETLS
jgi:hypothetical protein